MSMRTRLSRECVERYITNGRRERFFLLPFIFPILFSIFFFFAVMRGKAAAAEIYPRPKIDISD